MGDDHIPVTNANCEPQDERELSRLLDHEAFVNDLTQQHVREAKQLLDDFDGPYLGYLFGYHDDEVEAHPHGAELLGYFSNNFDEPDPYPSQAQAWVDKVAKALSYGDPIPHPLSVSSWRDEDGNAYVHCLRCGTVFQNGTEKPCSCPVGVERARPPEDGGNVQGGLTPGESPPY